MRRKIESLPDKTEIARIFVQWGEDNQMMLKDLGIEAG